MAGKELRVVIAADDKASPVFTQVANAAKSFAQALDDAGKQGEQSFSRIDKSTQTFGQQLDKVKGDLTTIGGLMTVTGGAITAAFVTPMLKGASAAFDQVRSVQQATVALKAYETNADAVNKVLSDLVKYARSDMGVLFQRQDLFAAAQNLKVMGAETQNLTRYVEVMSRSVGIGAASWDDLGQVIGRVGATGKLTSDDFDMLTKFGFQLDESFRNTKVTWDELFTALDKGIPATAMEGQAKTIDGMLIRLQSSIRNLGVEFLQIDKDTSEFIAGGLGDRLSQGIEQARQVMLSLAPAAQMAGEGVAILATAGAGLVDMYLSLPGPIQTAAAVMGSLTGVSTLAAGSFLLLLPRIADTVAAFRALGGISGVFGLLTSAITPVTLAIAGIGIALTAGAYLWKRQNEDVKAAQQAYADYGAAVTKVNDAIANEKLNGSDAMAARMESTAQLIRDSAAKGVSAAQEVIEHSKIDWNKVMDTKGAEESIAALTAYISDGMGKAALDWAHETGRLTDEAFNNIFINPMGNLGQIESIMKEYWSHLTPSDEDAAKIEADISKVFDLMSNPKIDQSKLTAGVQKIYAELAKTGDVDAADAAFLKLFADLEAGASSLNNVSQAAQLASQYIGEFEASLIRTNQTLAENGRLAAATGDAIAEMYRAQTGEYPAEDAARRHNDLLKERERLFHELGDAVDSGDQQKIDALTGQLKSVNDELAEGAFNAAKLGDAAASAAEKASAAMQSIMQAQKDAISGWMETTGNDDFVSQLNLAGLGTEYTQLAGNISDANRALEDGFRVIVGNTNAIAQQSQGVQDWADGLIGVQGEYGKVDDLLAAGTITLGEYNAAQQAQIEIAAANASIQQDVLTIQAKQAPLLADLTAQQAAYMDQLAGQPAQQQLIALGWMDSTESARAYTIMTQAAAVANGELGAGAEAAFSQMVQGAVAADPILGALLEDMGLISIGADGTVTVHFEGAESVTATLDDLNTSILTLADYLDNGIIDGSIDIKVKGREEMEKAKADAEALAAKNGTTVTIQYQVVAPTMGKDGGLGSGGYLDPANWGAVQVKAEVTEVDTSKVTTAAVDPVKVDADTSGAMSKIADIGAAIDAINLAPITLDVAVNGAELVGALKLDVQNLSDKTLTIMASVSGAEAISTLKTQVSDLSSKAFTITSDASDALLDIQAVLDLLAQITSKAFSISSDNTDAIADGQAVIDNMAKITSKAFSITSDNTDAIADSQAVVDKLTEITSKAFSITSDASDATTDIDAVKTGLDGIAAKTVTITGDATIAFAAIDNVNSATVNDKTMTIFGDATIAFGAITNVNNTAVNDKTFSIFGDATVALAAIDNVNNTAVNDKTMTISVVTQYSSVGSPPSGISAQRLGGIPAYATGGVLFRGGEAGPELAHFAGGGTAMLPNDGLYWAPQGTRIEPHNSVVTKLSPGGGMGALVHIENITIGAGADPAMAQGIVREIVTRLDRALEHRDRAGGLVA